MSRVGRVSRNHWVIKFLRHNHVVGKSAVPEDNVRLCFMHAEKGPIVSSLHLDVFVDNDERCLRSVREHAPNVMALYYENDDGRWRPPAVPGVEIMRTWPELHQWCQHCVRQSGRDISIGRLLTKDKSSSSFQRVRSDDQQKVEAATAVDKTIANPTCEDRRRMPPPAAAKAVPAVARAAAGVVANSDVPGPPRTRSARPLRRRRRSRSRRPSCPAQLRHHEVLIDNNGEGYDTLIVVNYHTMSLSWQPLEPGAVG